MIWQAAGNENATAFTSGADNPNNCETVRRVRNPTHGSGWIVQTQPTHGAHPIRFPLPLSPRAARGKRERKQRAAARLSCRPYLNNPHTAVWGIREFFHTVSALVGLAVKRRRATQQRGNSRFILRRFDESVQSIPVCARSFVN